MCISSWHDFFYGLELEKWWEVTQVQPPSFFSQILLSSPGLCLVIHYIFVTKITILLLINVEVKKKILGRIDNLKNREHVFSVMFLITLVLFFSTGSQDGYKQAHLSIRWISAFRRHWREGLHLLRLTQKSLVPREYFNPI